MHIREYVIVNSRRHGVRGVWHIMNDKADLTFCSIALPFFSEHATTKVWKVMVSKYPPMPLCSNCRSKEAEHYESVKS